MITFHNEYFVLPNLSFIPGHLWRDSVFTKDKAMENLISDQRNMGLDKFIGDLDLELFLLISFHNQMPLFTKILAYIFAGSDHVLLRIL